MAHKKGQGSVKNGRDSVSKRLGVKKFGSERVVAGTLSSVSGGQNFCPEETLGSAGTTRFLRSSMEACASTVLGGA